jgi:hypothetical protein
MRLLVCLAVAALASSQALSATVYDNGAFSSTASDIMSLLAADDFKLTKDTTIRGAAFHAFAEYGSYTPWDGTLDYAIFADDGGAPGALLTSGKGQTVQRTIVLDWGYPYGPQFKFEFAFQQAFEVKADTSYWFGLHIGEKYSGSYGWFWNFTSPLDGQNGQYAMTSQGGSMDNWINYNDADRAFTLSDTAPSPVPEPVGLTLLAAGGCVLGAFRSVRPRVSPA